MKKYFVALILSVFFLTGCGEVNNELTQTGENFFNLVKENNLDMAYLSTAQEFQDATTLEGLEYTIESYDLQNFESVTWTDSQIENNQGLARGMITLSDGKELSVEMIFVQRENEWQMMSVQFLNPNLAEDENLPKETDFPALINETVRLFVSDVQRGDFTQSYQETSALWKKEITKEQFQEAFQAFLQTEEDLSFVMNTDPELLTPPSIQQAANNTVILTLQGRYVGGEEKGNLLFDLKYVKENDRWSLAGINLGLQDPENAATTQQQEATNQEQTEN